MIMRRRRYHVLKYIVLPPVPPRLRIRCLSPSPPLTKCYRLPNLSACAHCGSGTIRALRACGGGAGSVFFAAAQGAVCWTSAGAAAFAGFSGCAGGSGVSVLSVWPTSIDRNFLPTKFSMHFCMHFLVHGHLTMYAATRLLLFLWSL